MFCFAPNNNAHHLTPTFYVSYLAGYPVTGQPDIRPDTKKGRISGATLPKHFAKLDINNEIAF